MRSRLTTGQKNPPSEPGGPDQLILSRSFFHLVTPHLVIKKHISRSHQSGVDRDRGFQVGSNFMKMRLLMMITALSCRAVWGGEVEPQLIYLQPYKPLYFIVGSPDTKVQLSFKGQIVRNLKLYFAYTQLLMWDLFQQGSPIRDVNYNPEMFYRFRFKTLEPRWLDLGADHESNGHGGTSDERAWNRVSLTYHSEHTLGKALHLEWSLKAWVPFLYRDTDINILHYRGLWEGQASLSNFLEPLFELSEVSVRFYPGGPSNLNPLQGGQELTLRLKLKARALLVPFIFQVFHGYGENLSNYTDNRVGVRAGIGL